MGPADRDVMKAIQSKQTDAEHFSSGSSFCGTIVARREGLSTVGHGQWWRTERRRARTRARRARKAAARRAQTRQPAAREEIWELPSARAHGHNRCRLEVAAVSGTQRDDVPGHGEWPKRMRKERKKLSEKEKSEEVWREGTLKRNGTKVDGNKEVSIRHPSGSSRAKSLWKIGDTATRPASRRS